jgi:hypothetical protein
MSMGQRAEPRVAKTVPLGRKPRTPWTLDKRDGNHEELGDLLHQIIFHAKWPQIGAFTAKMSPAIERQDDPTPSTRLFREATTRL